MKIFDQNYFSRVFKNHLIVFILLSLSTQSFSQLTPWNAHIVFHSRQGYTDTVVIGCDENGSWGYQAGIDVIDTILDEPGGIWGYDSIINSGSCGNLRKDVKNFVTGVQKFKFQVLDVDSNPQSFPYDFLTIDSNEFKFDNGEYVITYVWIRTLQGGFVFCIDCNDWPLYDAIDTSDQSYNAFYYDSISLIFEYDIFTSCIQTNDKQMQLQLEVGFNYYLGTGIIAQAKEKIEIVPNPSNGLFRVKGNTNYDNYEILNYGGQYLQAGLLKYDDLFSEIDASGLRSGLCFIKLLSHEGLVPPVLYKLIIQ